MKLYEIPGTCPACLAGSHDDPAYRASACSCPCHAKKHNTLAVQIMEAACYVWDMGIMVILAALTVWRAQEYPLSSAIAGIMALYVCISNAIKHNRKP